MSNPRFIYMNGALVEFDKAQVHVLSTAVKYSVHVFDGLRAYWNESARTLNVFRLQDHTDRLLQSARLMRMEMSAEALDPEYWRRGLEALVEANELRQDAHIRFDIYSTGTGDVDSSGPAATTIAALPRGRLASGGIRCKVASWTRIQDNSMPPRIKGVGNYVNSRLALIEAKQDGYDNTILLTAQGTVAEAPGGVVFLVRGGTLITPDFTSAILESITRDTVIALHRDAGGGAAIERKVDRTELYAADEVFLCGTSYEILPVTEIDRLPVGNGRPGPVTTALGERYMAVVRGDTRDFAGWRTVIRC